MVMTRKDYKIIADCLNNEAESVYSYDSNDNMSRWLKVNEVRSLRDRLAWELSKTNPNYNKDKFFKATSRVDELERKLFNEED